MEKTERINIVCNDHDGIQPMFVDFYLLSMKDACNIAHSAFRKYDDNLKPEQMELAVTALQEALTYTSILSKFLWPPSSKILQKKRGKKLREILNIDNNSPLKNRELRNALEHYDERLDDYLLYLESGHILPSVMINDHTLADEATAHIFKLLDPNACCFVLFNKKYWFAEIRNEFEKIFLAIHNY